MNNCEYSTPVVITGRYPNGVVLADEYLKGVDRWGFLFGGVLRELYKENDSHPEERKDVDVYVPYLDDLKSATRMTKVDFWTGVPGMNLSREFKLNWLLHPEWNRAASLDSGLYILDDDSFKCMMSITGEQVDDVVSSKEVQSRILSDTGLSLKLISAEIVRSVWRSHL